MSLKTFNKSLSKTEIIAIIVALVAIIGLLYYQFIFTSFEAQKASYDTSDIESQIEIEQQRLATMQRMQEEMKDTSKKKDNSYIETYNNLKSEIVTLNDIFDDSDTFSLSFEDPVATGDAVRRNITVTFSAKNYKTAKKIIKNLHNCKYKCIIRDLSITASQSNDGSDNAVSSVSLDNSKVNVTLNVTFFETLTGATTTDGLTIEQSDDSSDTNLTDELSSDKERAESTGMDDQ